MSDAYLEVASGPECQSFPLACAQICYIGRGGHNTIVLSDNQVSSKHAMVQCTPTGEFYLTDLGSRNGTFVNRQRVTVPVLLQPGDRITLGMQELVFHGPCARVHAADRGETIGMFSQQLITVLVADIRDFTGLSSRLGEGRISEVVSAFTRESGRILGEHGAWAQKYIGDAVMAIWLHPRHPPDPMEICTALAALTKLFDLAASIQAQFQLEMPFRIGAGMNTGLACIGNMGSDEFADYTAVSDAVNLAFRLESATKDIGCDLAAGRRTYEFLTCGVPVGDLFAMHTVPLKGYKEPKPVYAISRPGLESLLAAVPAEKSRV